MAITLTTTTLLITSAIFLTAWAFLLTNLVRDTNTEQVKRNNKVAFILFSIFLGIWVLWLVRSIGVDYRRF